jgi:hypothetical protein
MKRSPGIMLLSLFLATPSMSQSLDVSVIPTPYDLGRVPAQPQLTHKEPIIIPQLVERFELDGVRVRQRGIIVGKDIAPAVTVGLGFVDRKPRRSGFYPDGQPDSSSRRSGKASMLLILKF